MPQKLQPQKNNFYGFPDPSPKASPPPVIADRAPTTADTGYSLGQEWIYEGTAAYILLGVSGGSATWEETGGGSVQVGTLTGDSGTATPAAGNIQIAGGTNITTSAATSVVTVDLDATLTGLTSVASTTITTNVAAAQLSLAGTTISGTGTDANISLTLTPKGTGGVNVTTGSLSLSGAASQLRVEGGAATDFIGTGTLTAGTVTIANTNIAATDRIFLSRTAANASTALGMLTYTISAGASFTVTALETATPADTEVNDVSSFAYFIVRQL